VHVATPNGIFFSIKTPRVYHLARSSRLRRPILPVMTIVRSWQRFPNGKDTDTDADWVFRDATKNLSNGGEPVQTSGMGFSFAVIAVGAGAGAAAGRDASHPLRPLEHNLGRPHSSVEYPPGYHYSATARDGQPYLKPSNSESAEIRTRLNFGTDSGCKNASDPARPTILD